MPDTPSARTVTLAEDHARLLPLRVAVAPVVYDYETSPRLRENPEAAFRRLLDFYIYRDSTTAHERRLMVEVLWSFDLPGYAKSLTHYCFQRVTDQISEEEFRERRARIEAERDHHA